MNEMFWNAEAFNQPLNKWNVSKVKYTYAMFAGARSFNQPLNKWNVSNVKITSSMFWNATSFDRQTHALWTSSELKDTQTAACAFRIAC